ncbi:hypothetical protein FHETE_3566 [Fusarium heterosporum]|uniref:Uncharacterized protein n=1 Tax=Fusarium heterosporum TaxID=42747 RepID=A0A8H5WUY7_FUSHE|nr:hypothetical protein FHETE_3566 [Fusarium heterosporum]
MSETPLILAAHRLTTGGQKDKKHAAQPWTAARCQRLLRQLQCRLTALRKLVKEARQPPAAVTTITQAKRTSTDEEASKPPKRARYTYGRRRQVPAQAKSSVSPLSTPPRTVRTLGSMKIERSPAGVARIDFAKPLVQEFNYGNPTSETSSERLKQRSTGTKSLVTDLQSLRRIIPDGQYRIYEVIFGWLNGLLSSTESLSQTAHPKSLLGMCLRKVPDALAVIEEWDRQSAAEEGKSFKWESSKASTELYEQLEGFGSSSLGWNSLKLVLRAHALCLLAEAVAEGLFEPPTPAPSTVDFMCTALNQLLLDRGKAEGTGQPSEEQALINILAAIAAAIWTLGASMDIRERWRTHAIRRLLFILESCVSQQHNRRRGFHSGSLFIIVLARFTSLIMVDNDVVCSLARNLSIYDSMKLMITARNSSPTQLQYRQTLLLLCSVAQYRGQACGLPCHDVLSEIRASLIGLGLPTWFQEGLVSDGAFVLAQKTKDLRDVAFAERFPTSGKGTLEASTIFAGWRWEEGIGEWVVPSPVQKRRRELRQQDHGHDGTTHRTGTCHQLDGQDRIASPEEKRAGQGSNLRDRGGKGMGDDDDDDTNDTDEEDGNDTSDISITDIDRQQDSGDELGDCAQMMDHNLKRVSKQKHYHFSSSKKTVVRVVKKVRYLSTTRIWQDNKLGRGDNVSMSEQQEDGMEDELSLLETI